MRRPATYMCLTAKMNINNESESQKLRTLNSSSTIASGNLIQNQFDLNDRINIYALPLCAYVIRKQIKQDTIFYTLSSLFSNAIKCLDQHVYIDTL